jgi:hypothetical protein
MVLQIFRHREWDVSDQAGEKDKLRPQVFKKI